MWSLEKRQAELALVEEKVEQRVKAGIEPRPLWLEGKDLTNCANYAALLLCTRFDINLLYSHLLVTSDHTHSVLRNK